MGSGWTGPTTLWTPSPPATGRCDRPPRLLSAKFHTKSGVAGRRLGLEFVVWSQRDGTAVTSASSFRDRIDMAEVPASRASRSGSDDGGVFQRKAPFACQRSEEHTSELQSLMRNSYAFFCLK